MARSRSISIWKRFLRTGSSIHVYLAAQYAGQAPFELAQAAEVVETRRRETLAEAHRQVDVACGFLPARQRTEQ
jgi:hypothetical protein